MFASHYVTVNGSRMHYWDEGVGNPILFIHGMPTSNYLWRHIIPALSTSARCIAPDLIGMGKSDKPNIAYTVRDHIQYLELFIQALGLSNITLVMHGWGSVIGLDYARRHENNIRALVLYESYIKPITAWTELSLPMQQFCTLLKNKNASERAILDQNYLVEKMFPRSAITNLSQEAMSYYREPFSYSREPFSPRDSQKLLWKYVNELPLGDGTSEASRIIQQYSVLLQKTTIPKLLMYAIPGFCTTIEMVHWSRDHYPNLQLTALEDVMHCAQETAPQLFSNALLKWYQGLSHARA